MKIKSTIKWESARMAKGWPEGSKVLVQDDAGEIDVCNDWSPMALYFEYDGMDKFALVSLPKEADTHQNAVGIRRKD